MKQKTYNVYYAIFFLIIAIVLFTFGLYSKNYYVLIVAVIICLIDWYWVLKALKKPEL